MSPNQQATKPQINYIEQLLIDVGIGINRYRRNAELSLIVQRQITYLDDLSKGEASLVIDKLKEIKEDQLNGTGSTRQPGQ